MPPQNTIISSSYAHGIVLTNVVTTILSAAKIGTAGVGNGAYASFQSHYTLLNAGYIGGDKGTYLPGYDSLTNTGTIYGSTDGAKLALYTGSVTNDGLIEGVASYGVIANNVTNNGVVIGGATGVLSFSVTNAGQISGNLGVDSYVVTNASGGTISGIAEALLLTNVGSNYGQLTGQVDGVYLEGALTNAAGGTITGGTNGLLAASQDFTPPSVVVNYGLIASTATSSGSGVYIGNGNCTITNQSTGTITGVSAGVTGPGLTLVNQGTVSSAGTGVVLAPGNAVGFLYNYFPKILPALLTNLAGGSIFGGVTGVQSTYAANTLTNAGSITSTTTGVQLTNGAGLSNQSTGVISASAGTGVSDIGGTVSNQGQVAGSTQGVYLAGGALVNTGTVSSQNTGVLLSASSTATDDLTNMAGGVIDGVYYAVNVQAAGSSVTNNGAINATQDGVYLAAGGTFTNGLTGSVTGNYAVYAITMPATVINAGTIATNGTAGSGVYLHQGGSVTNQTTGAITGSTYGIFAKTAASVVNTGSISGGAYGVWLNGGGTLVNAGTIGGVQAAYVKGNATVVVDPGAVFQGNVIGAGSGSRVLDLASASSAGTIGSVGAGGQFSGFTTVNLDAGAQWTLTGSTAPVFLGGGGDVLTTGTGAVTVIAGANTVGADTINLGTGVATLDIAKNLAASITITGLMGNDAIHLTGFGAGAVVTALGGNQYQVGTAASHEVFNVSMTNAWYAGWATHVTVS